MLDPTAAAHLDTEEVTRPAFFAYLDILGDPIRATTAGRDWPFAAPYDRTNHLYNSAAQGAVAGYLDARTNHYLWSQKIGNSVWQKAGLTVTDDYTTAPDGSSTASRLVPSTSTTNHYILQNLSVTAGLYYTDSFRAKADGYTWVQVTPSTGFDPVGDYVNVNLLDGSIGNSNTTNGLKVTVEALEDGWYEIRATALCTVTAVGGRFLVAPIDSNRAGRNPSWAGNDTDGILVWGRQFEQAATATDYIPTTTAAVTAPATGAVPTGWLWGAVPGLVRRVLGSGVDAQGRKFTDFHVQGTNTHSSTGYAHLNVGRAEQATTGETWTFSGGVEDILGTTKAGFSNAVGTIEWQELRSSGNYLTGTTQVLTRDGVRRSVQRTLTHTEAVKVQAVVNGSIMPGSSVNWAFRVYEPMLEKQDASLGISYPTAYIETTAGPVTVTVPGETGDADLDGFTFLGLDPRFVNIGDVVNQEGGSDTLTCSLSGLLLPDADLLATIADPVNWRGREARLWVLVRDENDTAKGAVAHYYTGYMVALEIKPGRDQQTIELKIENYLALLSQASNRSYLSQSEYDPADTSARATIGAANGVREGPAAMLGTPSPHDLRSVGPGGIHPV